jgi:hypothetical protein
VEVSDTGWAWQSCCGWLSRHFRRYVRRLRGHAGRWQKREWADIIGYSIEAWSYELLDIQWYLLRCWFCIVTPGAWFMTGGVTSWCQPLRYFRFEIHSDLLVRVFLIDSSKCLNLLCQRKVKRMLFGLIIHLNISSDTMRHLSPVQHRLNGFLHQQLPFPLTRGIVSGIFAAKTFSRSLHTGQPKGWNPISIGDVEVDAIPCLGQARYCSCYSTVCTVTRRIMSAHFCRTYVWSWSIHASFRNGHFFEPWMQRNLFSHNWRIWSDYRHWTLFSQNKSDFHCYVHYQDHQGLSG